MKGNLSPCSGRFYKTSSQGLTFVVIQVSMKKFLLLVLLFTGVAVSAQFTGYNMIQLGRWDNDDLPALGSQQFSNGWGWADSSNGKEYAIVGSIDSTYFIDISNPAKPVVCAVRAGKSPRSVWREYKTYKNYCYAVADHGQASLQIFDMSYLPDSVHLVYDSDSLVMRSHTVYIDGDRLYCNSVVTRSNQVHAVDVFSLADPENPTFLGTLEPPIFDGVPAFVKCHDAFIKNDTLYCSGENAGVFIYNMKDAANGQLLGTIQEYPEKGYNHSGYLSDDGKIFVFTDENSGLGIKAYDMSNFNDFELKSVFRSHSGAIAHNPYFIGRRLYMSYYHDGVYVFNMNDPAKPEVIAWYDTYPQNGTNYGGFVGCWGIYPFLPSGNLLAFDMTNGLFVLRMDATASEESPAIIGDVKLYPNPTGSNFELSWNQVASSNMEIVISDMQGCVVSRQSIEAPPGVNQHLITLSGVKKGMYLVQLTGANTHICKKLLLH